MTFPLHLLTVPNVSGTIEVTYRPFSFHRPHLKSRPAGARLSREGSLCLPARLSTTKLRHRVFIALREGSFLASVPQRTKHQVP